MQGMDPLDLLFERLVRAVRDTRPEFLTRPFEVAELMELVPYRSMRGAASVETNDDYAHALTRLLAGEGGYIFADDLLQDDLRAELASPSPDLAAYRAYLTARHDFACARTQGGSGDAARRDAGHAGRDGAGAGDRRESRAVVGGDHRAEGDAAVGSRRTAPAGPGR